MSGRTVSIVIAALVVVAAGVGVGAYELGLRNARPAAQVSTASPTPRLQATRSSTPTATAGPRIFPAVSPVHNAVVDGLHCKLPIYLPGQPGSGGWISFPDGAVTADSTSSSTAPFPGGGGGDWFGLTYDRAVNQWLPVPRGWVSPNGAIYVFALDFNLHAGVNYMVEVNAQTGAASTIYPEGPGWQVIDVESAYVYAISTHGPGMYVLTLTGPSSSKFVSDGFWTAASGFYAYGSATLDGGAIVRMDTRDPTQRVAWFNKSSSADVIGFDGSGNPVISTGTELWIASAPDQAIRISSEQPLPNPGASNNRAQAYGATAPVPDSHGLWFATSGGIYLYAGGQSTKVSNLVAQPAGDCI
ncbi:MAG TPA: hypothetical protein VJP81_11450 [Candidatus Dormibacteraeota bacterium]|nr:hypothetical protein [Candidatus Dormibacteraeota bacterium]